jgi:ATP-dependent DNA helicase 2 subunit 2
MQAENEALLRTICEQCDGVLGTLEQAVSEMVIPRVKVVRSPNSFKDGYLQLGNPNEYDTAVRIPVERYSRTMVAKPPSASQFVQRSDLAAGEEEPESSATVTGTQPQEGGSLTSVRNLRAYQVSDESAPGGKIDIEREDLAKGYEYGRTAVHISETDENITRLDTQAALELVGFIQSEKVCLRMFIGVAPAHLPSTSVICTCPPRTLSSPSARTTKPRLHYLPSSMLFLN